jgi:hypothetical protein
MLYVAEGGMGGVNSTIGLCQQVEFPVGPYTGSQTSGRISMVNSNGMRTTVTDQLPSSRGNPIIGGDINGVADIAFIGDDMYAVLAGAGCSHGVQNFPNSILKINPDGSWNMVADLSAWISANPVANPGPDFEPDGVWYSMEAVNGYLYALEPNRGELIKVSPSGDISRVIDISATEGHIVPTALAYHGNFYMGNLGLFPIAPGSSNIYKISPEGDIKIWAEGFNTILGLVIDQNKRMYVLEMTVGAPFPTPGTGRITMVHPSGTKTVLVNNLSLPTGMTMGPDGNLYVSNWGFGPNAIGGGQVLKITLAQ